ncbi:MAG: hypothetical protein SH859_15800 [Hyphomicrobium aestuarii]|nr:hypothetical protein [Hyphomicrobium aestuarii]
MTYADGLLDADERTKIAAFLETDPEARETVAMFERTAALVAGVSDEAFDAPMPEGLIALIREGGPALSAKSALDAAGTPSAATVSVVPATATIIQMRPRQRSAWVPSRRDIAAVAACLAVVAGVSMLWLAQPDGDANDASAVVALGPVPSDGLLASVLERRPSYQPLALSTGRGEPLALVAMSTFRDQGKRYCREFELTSGVDQRPTALGVACRETRGLWTVEGVAKIATTAGTSPGAEPGAMKPAGGHDAAALDGVMSKLGANPALSKDDEAAILARGWR